MKIVIVGGVAGGASAAARLRRLDERAEIVMFERGEYVSFANCGLPYYVGGKIESKQALTLQTPASFHSRFRVDVRVKSEVTALHPQSKTVSVRRADGSAYEESYDRLILAPGAAPIVPLPVKSDRVFTLRNMEDAIRMKTHLAVGHPRTAVVIGGGFIGVEIAENLVRAGLKVTLVDLADQVLPPLDREMACRLHRHMEASGVTLRLGCGVKSIGESGGSVAIGTDAGEVKADMAVLAVGVRPDTALAKDAGIDLDECGAILTDAHMLTSVSDIYAVGDAVKTTDFVTGAPAYVPLAGPANKQGRIAADNICGIPSEYRGTQGSSVAKVFGLTAASTGLSEKTAKRAGIRYMKSYTYSAAHATYYPDAGDMCVKILFAPDTGKLLGAQVVGSEGVDKRCDVFATAIRAGMTVYDLTRLELCYAPPYGSAKDPVNMAGYVAENILTAKVKPFYIEDVADLQKRDDVVLLDVRTDPERSRGSIPGFLGITLDELRDRIRSLDKSKKVYVTCQVGLRGYIACRILMQNGFDAYNLSGGYRLYNAVYA